MIAIKTAVDVHHVSSCFFFPATSSAREIV